MRSWIYLMTFGLFLSGYAEAQIIFTWKKGSNVVYPATDYGTQNVTASSNTPGGRNGGASAINSAGEMYYFGGYGNGTTAGGGSYDNYWGDLWKWDGTNWTWVSGSSTADETGTYGTKGVADPGNTPPCRWGGVAWFDSNDNFYVFGGETSTGNGLNDLWKWDGTNWTWISGANTTNVSATFGTINVSSASNTPGALVDPSAWIDDNDNLFLFGGYSAANIAIEYGQVWKFNVSTSEWTWVKGATTNNEAPNYGTLNVTASSNTPGGRSGCAAFDVGGDEFYLFSGISNGSGTGYADLWKWDGTDWTWVDGPSGSGGASVYSPLGLSLSDANPGTTVGALSGVDPETGDFWLFGGDDGNSVAFKATLWKYSILDQDWAWMGGNTTINYTGSYGTLGVGDNTTLPPSRFEAGNSRLYYNSGSSNFQILLGSQSSNLNYLNDVWELSLTTIDPMSITVSPAFAWQDGSSSIFPATDYGTQNVTASTNTPGGRYGGASAVNSSGEMYYFGGYGNNTTAGGGGAYNYWGDLWKWDGTNWTWVSGSTTANETGTYGTKGVAAPSNTPPCRWAGVAWFDSNDNFYVFGGERAAGNHLNDLWKWDGTNWTWISGANTSNSSATYGTMGVASSSNTPGPLTDPFTWVDGSDNLFLFGGADGSLDFYDDVWKFDVSTSEWTWVKGSGTTNSAADYGTIDVAASSNTPGARASGACFDVSGSDFYLYGGRSASTSRNHMDMWKWDGTNWTWVDGAQTLNNYTPVLGAVDAVDPTYTPASLFYMLSFVHPITGDFWIYGGAVGGASTTSSNFWRYDIVDQDWAWMGGSGTNNFAGAYGIKGVGTPESTLPRARLDAGGALLYYDNTSKAVQILLGSWANHDNYLNDVWSYGSEQNVWNGEYWTLTGTTTDDAYNAIIASNTSPGNLDCLDLYTAEGKTLTTKTGDVVTIDGDLYNNGSVSGTGRVVFTSATAKILGDNAVTFEGDIVVNAAANLSTNDKLTLSASSAESYGTLSGDGSVTGNVTSQTYLTPSAGGRYYHMGSPFTNATLLDLNEGSNLMVSANTAQGTTWEWDAANAEWAAANSGDLNTTATPGKGYAIFAGTNTHGTFLRSGNGTVDMTGTVSSSDVSASLAYNDGQSSSLTFAGGTDVASTQGWNLVSNPYPSQYDWNAPTVPSGLGTAKYVFNGSTWSVYNNGVGSGNRYIAPYQAFMVQYTSDPGVAQNLVFSASKRVAGETVSLSKTKPNGVTLFVSGTLGIEDQVYVGLEPMATDGFDPSLDAHKLLNAEGIPNVYAVLNGEKYSIARVPYHSITDFPMTLVHSVHGEALTVRADASALSSNYGVILEDLKTGVMHDLETGDYHFNYDENFNGGDRFILHLDQSTIGIEEEHPTIAQAYAWNTENSIEVETQVEGVYEVEVYNVTGQLMVSAQGSGQVSLPMSGTSRGIYLVRVSQNGLTKTIKIIR